MKKVILLRLVALLLMALVPLLMPAVNTIIYNATYDFNNLTLGTDTLGGVTYTTVNYDGLFNGGEPGKPSLPVDYIKFSVPYNATNFTVTATLQNNMISNLSSYLVYPCQPARMMNDTTPIVITLPDNSVYNSNSYYPSQNAWVVDEGFLAGENHIVTVAVMPLSYKHRVMGNLTTNQLRKTGTVRLVLSYDLSDTPAMYPIIRKDTTLRQEGYALTRTMVANPDNVLFNAPTDINMNPLDPNSLNPGDGLNGGVNPPNPPNPNDTTIYNGGELEMAGKYRYLIVTTSELKHSLRRLAALKRQKGYGVKVVTMDEVMNDSVASLGDRFKQPDGSYHVAYNDDAGKLRQYLKYAYSTLGTKYVLLAGKSIPYRHIDEIVEDSGRKDTIDCISDFYYIELNSDWSDSISDHQPELYVGRILCESSEQIENNTNKLFRYELNPGNGDYSYLQRILYQEGESFARPLKTFKDTIFEIFPKEISIEMKENSNSIHLTGKDVIDTINNNPVALINIFNHGDTVRISVHSDSSQPKNYIYSLSSATDGNGFNCLNNRNYPMIFYSPVCQTVPFDNNIGVNLGESFTTGKDYGGPVYIGNTRKTLIRESTNMSSYFAIQLKKGVYTLGAADALSIMDCVTDRYCQQDVSLIHAYIGDPALEIWTDIPDQYDNVNVSRTNNSMTITGINKDSTIVSYCDNAGGIRKKTASSTVTFSNVSPNGSLMLYRHNSIPYIAPMVLQNAILNESQYVVASDVTAGTSVDGIRSRGDVIVKSGVEYEIEASGTVTLCDGFEVEQGATFSVIPSTF